MQAGTYTYDPEASIAYSCSISPPRTPQPALAANRCLQRQSAGQPRKSNPNLLRQVYAYLNIQMQAELLTTSQSDVLPSLLPSSGTSAFSDPHCPSPPPLPLTNHNLRLLDRPEMPQPEGPATPASSHKNKTTTFASTSSNMRKTSYVRNIVAYNQIVIDYVEEATEMSGPVLAAARDIANGPRGSTMRLESRNKIEKVRRVEGSSNELSF